MRRYIDFASIGHCLGLMVATSIFVNDQSDGILSVCLIKRVGDTKLRGAANPVSDSFKL